jgi:hypothetical protein
MTGKLRLLAAALLLSVAPSYAQAPGVSDMVLTPGSAAGDRIGGHGFTITYEETAVEGMQDVRNMFQRDGVFQEIFDEVSAQIALPRDVAITFRDCGEPSAFWSSDDKTVTMCYELISLYNTSYEQIETAEQGFLQQASVEQVLTGTTLFVMLHELGHGLIDLFDLPITGKEEDAADQFAAMTLIGSDEDDDALEDRPSRLALLGAYFFQKLSHSPDSLTRQILSNEHALGQQRYYEVMCLVLGSNTEVYGPIVALGVQMVNDAAQNYPYLVTDARIIEWLERTDDLNILPYKRALRCEKEFQRYNASWDYLIDTFMVPQKND